MSVTINPRSQMRPAWRNTSPEDLHRYVNSRPMMRNHPRWRAVQDWRGQGGYVLLMDKDGDFYLLRDGQLVVDFDGDTDADRSEWGAAVANNPLVTEGLELTDAEGAALEMAHRHTNSVDDFVNWLARCARLVDALWGNSGRRPPWAK